MDFKTAYPLVPKSVVYAPMTFRMGLDFLHDVPETTLKGIRDLAHYAGIADGAVRTTLSREKAAGLIESYKESDGITRYRMAMRQFDMGRATIDRENKQGFILAVFSFTTNEVSERSAVRLTLKNYGFRKLAQNTYINGEIETSGLVSAMKEFGLEKNLYLFHCPDIDDPVLIEKILLLFDIPGRSNELKNFFQDMRSFLTERGITGDEAARRILYLAPLHYEIGHVNEFPIPAKYLPPDYALKDIHQFYHNFIYNHRAQLREYYIRVNQ